MLQKGVYPYECMNEWEKFSETLLPEKEGFYSSQLNMEDVTDTDYAHAESVCKGFQLKNLGKYHDLCVQSDVLLLVDVFDKSYLS